MAASLWDFVSGAYNHQRRLLLGRLDRHHQSFTQKLLWKLGW
jgi:hypothetical protein